MCTLGSEQGSQVVELISANEAGKCLKDAYEGPKHNKQEEGKEDDYFSSD